MTTPHRLAPEMKILSGYGEMPAVPRPVGPSRPRQPPASIYPRSRAWRFHSVAVLTPPFQRAHAPRRNSFVPTPYGLESDRQLPRRSDFRPLGTFSSLT